MKYSHLFLRNPLGEKHYVYTNRYAEQSNNEDEEDEIKDYSRQKDRLKKSLIIFRRNRVFRREHKTIHLPYNLEYIEIRFFTQFNKDFAGKNDYYKNNFGLIPVSFKDFNKTVLFYIENERLFSRFVSLIEQFFNSSDNTDPSNKDYHVVTLIYSFEFLSSNKIKNISNTRIILSLTNKLRGDYKWDNIRQKLISYIEEKGGGYIELSEGVLELSNTEDFIDEIIDNFDVIQKIQSIPPVRVTPGAFGTRRFSWDFESSYNENLPIVGIIDSGIDNRVDPLKPLLIDNVSILSGSTGIGSSHGTSVASLVAFGDKLISPENPKVSSANLYSIQVLYRDEGSFSYDKLRKAIIEAHNGYGIRIFNLSVCDERSFEYNAEFSEYAKMLDELAYTYDLLIFIAAGNLVDDYIEFIKSDLGRGTHLINYPNHYYNALNNDYSQPTNIGSPAESMNNITIGAIACNNIDNITDLTDRHTLPSYYSRKYHIDYAQTINGSGFNKNQKNKNIFKPDILMPGGDWLHEDSKMLVLSRGLTPNDYYIRLSGTSLATPLAANLAAKIISKYPDINMQSVKALLINSAESTNIEESISNIINECKEIESQNIHGCSFTSLSSKEKRRISTKFNSNRLAKCIEGNGVPNEDKCLSSTNKRATFVIEDQIPIRHYHVKHIKLPDYLSSTSKKMILKITGTLCFKFSPIKDDAMAYNPIHISFNYVNAQENSQMTAIVVANERNSYKQPLIEPEEQKNMLRIKSKMSSWSEDFGYINRQLFSNTQKMDLIINKEDLLNINNEFAVVIRCLGKDNYTDERIENPYSLVISIEEFENSDLDEYNLYEELSAINEVENITELDTELDIEIAD